MVKNVKGLVLKEVKVGDADKIITILTDEMGKISASVKGAANLKSRRIGGTKPFCFSKFSLNERGGRFYVSEAAIEENFFAINESIEKLALASYFLELCAFTSSELEPANDALRLTLNGLFLLTKNDKPLPVIKAAYELRLLSSIGHMPDLTCCSVCASYEKNMLFDIKEGILVCAGCASGTAGTLRLPLKTSVLKAMRHIIYSDENKIFSFELSDEGMTNLSSCVESYILTQLDSGFKTLNFYKSVINT